MDWIKQNRFLAGYIGVMTLGTIGLGFYLFTGWKGAKAASESYQETARNVDMLERRPIFPSEENLEAKRRQVAAYGTAVDQLQEQLTRGQRAIKPGLKEQDFRKIMNGEVEAVAAMAASKGMRLPEEFRFGLDAYTEGKPINPRAVPLLEWELDAMKQFVNLAAAAGIDSIEDFRRDEFPQEDRNWKSEKEIAEAAAEEAAANPRRRARRAPRGAAKKPQPKAGSDNPMATASEVMETYRFTALVKGSHDSLSDLLTRMANDETFFVWLRQLRVENEVKESPREGDVPDPEPVPDVDPGEDGVGPMIDATLLFGAEKVYAELVIDMVRFKEVEGGAPPAGGAG